MREEPIQDHSLKNRSCFEYLSPYLRMAQERINPGSLLLKSEASHPQQAKPVISTNSGCPLSLAKNNIISTELSDLRDQ